MIRKIAWKEHSAAFAMLSGIAVLTALFWYLWRDFYGPVPYTNLLRWKLSRWWDVIGLPLCFIPVVYWAIAEYKKGPRRGPHDSRELVVGFLMLPCMALLALLVGSLVILIGMLGIAAGFAVAAVAQYALLFFFILLLACEDDD